MRLCLEIDVGDALGPNPGRKRFREVPEQPPNLYYTIGEHGARGARFYPTFLTLAVDADRAKVYGLLWGRWKLMRMADFPKHALVVDGTSVLHAASTLAHLEGAGVLGCTGACAENTTCATLRTHGG